MKVIILGTARSGTTALYSLLQEIMPKTCGRTDFVYEPFLRERSLFNGPYREVDKHFASVASLSHAGIAAHLKLPLLIKDPTGFTKNAFLKSIFRPQPRGSHLLLKFIRANGRIRLLHSICPEGKFIFILRNPVDVVNSILRLFSFYGGEFHKDDFPRFLAEVNTLYQQTYMPAAFPDAEDREFLYWWYMNSFALEAIQQLEPPPLVICHEEYVRNSEVSVKRLCDYLAIEFDAQFVAIARQNVGSITSRFEIPERKLELYQEYLRKYCQLLQTFQIDHHINESEIFSRYQIAPNSLNRNNPFYGLHALEITRKYQLLAAQLQQKDKHVQQQQEALQQKDAIIAQKDQTIQKIIAQKDEYLRQQELRLQQKDTYLNQKDEIIARTEEQLQQKETMITQAEEQLQQKEAMIIRTEEQLLQKDEIVARIEEQLLQKEAIITQNEQTNQTIIAQKDEQLRQQRQELCTIVNSPAYKVGKIVVAPISSIKHWAKNL